MSATRGILMPFFIPASAAAASSSGTATRMISHPTSSSSLIWRTVAATSRVSVLHIDWIEMAASPPTMTPPMFMGLDFLLLGMSNHQEASVGDKENFLFVHPPSDCP